MGNELRAKHFPHHRAPEYGRGWKKKKVFKTSRRKEKMAREKQRGKKK